jgi:hypothetical protein
VRTSTLLPLTAVIALGVSAPTSSAQVRDVDVIASGLDNPRHVAVAPNGDVYVAESGRGGDPARSRSCFDSAEGFACTGATGAVTRISHRRGRYRQRRIMRRLPSFAPDDGASAIGPHGVYVRGRDVLMTNGGPTAPTRGEPAEVVLRDPTLVAEHPMSARYGTLLARGRRGGIRQIADIWRFERIFNPDAELGNPLIDSNPVDVLPDRGGYIVADAGSNTLLRVSRRGAVRVLSLFPNVDTPGPQGTVAMNAVPTGVVKGRDGRYYVSQLTGFPFPVGGANVFRVDPRSGAVTTYASGFTNAMDLDFARNGTLYVLEIDRNGLLTPGRAGGLWAVPRGGGKPRRIRLPAGTLVEPGGIAVGRRGELYVSNRGRNARNGQVLRIRLRR